MHHLRQGVHLAKAGAQLHRRHVARAQAQGRAVEQPELAREPARHQKRHQRAQAHEPGHGRQRPLARARDLVGEVLLGSDHDELPVELVFFPKGALQCHQPVVGQAQALQPVGPGFQPDQAGLAALAVVQAGPQLAVGSAHQRVFALQRRNALELAARSAVEVFGARGRDHQALRVHQVSDRVVAHAGAADQVGQAGQAHVHRQHAQQGLLIGLKDGLRQSQVELVLHRRAVHVGEHPLAGAGGELVPGALARVVHLGFGLDQAAAVARLADEEVAPSAVAGADGAHDEAGLFAFQAEEAAVLGAEIQVGHIRRLLRQRIGHELEGSGVLEPVAGALALGTAGFEGWHQRIDHGVRFAQVGQGAHVHPVRGLAHRVLGQCLDGLRAVGREQPRDQQRRHQRGQHQGGHEGRTQRKAAAKGRVVQGRGSFGERGQPANGSTLQTSSGSLRCGSVSR